MKTKHQNIKIVGRVTYGNGLGQRFGFPTANLTPTEQLEGVSDGVWAAVAEVDGKLWHAVVNIGFSPSVVAAGGRRIEAHIMGYEGDLYGKTLTLSLRHYIREERKFPTREALIEQIGHDRDRAEELLNEETN